MSTNKSDLFLNLLAPIRLNTKHQQHEMQNWIENYIKLEPLSTVPLYELYEY